MKVLFYVLLMGAFGAFMVGCADLDYVDDYSDSTFYDDEYSDEYSDEIIEDDEYIEVDDTEEIVDEEVVNIAKALSDTQPKDSLQDSKATSKQAKEMASDKKSIAKEPQHIAQSTPAPKAESTPKPTPKPAPRTDGITIIDDNTFTYNGMTFKHNLGKDADLSEVISTLEGDSKKHKPKAQEPRPIATKSHIKPGAKLQTLKGKGLNGLRQSTTKLKAQCENNANLQKCEDLGRIYAMRGNIDLALPYYENACNSGEGSMLSCFFLSKIYENNGDSAMAQQYTDILGGRVAKIGSVELNLSIGKAESAKQTLKMSCTKGTESSCKTLQSIFRLRGEKREMRTYFGTECWRGSALGCEILRGM